LLRREEVEPRQTRGAVRRQDRGAPAPRPDPRGALRALRRQSPFDVRALRRHSQRTGSRSCRPPSTSR
jgi:hypothetical protein